MTFPSSDVPFGLCIGACCTQPTPLSDCEDEACIDGKIPECWEVTIAGSGLMIDGVSINGTYSLKNMEIDAADHGQSTDPLMNPASAQCGWHYLRFCESDDPKGCFYLMLGIGSGEAWLKVYNLNNICYSPRATLTSFSVAIENPVDCVNGSLVLDADLVGHTGTATITATDSCGSNYYDYYTAYGAFLDPPTCGHWYENLDPCWPPTWCSSNFGCTAEGTDYCTRPAYCLPGSLIVTISNTVLTTGSPCGEEETINGEYEVPFVRSLERYQYRGTFCDMPLIIYLNPRSFGSNEWSGRDLVLLAGESAEIFQSSIDGERLIPDVSYESWANFSRTMYWHFLSWSVGSCEEQYNKFSIYFDDYVVSPGTYWEPDIYDDVNECETIGMTITSGDSCVVPTGGYTPPPPKETCTACGSSEAAKCWRATFTGSSTELYNGRSVNLLDLQLPPDWDPDTSCVWEQEYYCSFGECFTAQLSITEDSGTATINLRLVGDPTNLTDPGIIAEFEDDFAAPIDCNTGSFELPEITAGGGTATVTAYANANCEQYWDGGWRCSLSGVGHSCKGCQPNKLMVHISNTVVGSPEDCELDGYYEITRWNSPCEYHETFEICGVNVTIRYQIGKYLSGGWWDYLADDPGYDCLSITCEGSPYALAWVNITKGSRGECSDVSWGSWSWCEYFDCEFDSDTAVWLGNTLPIAIIQALGVGLSVAPSGESCT